MPAFVLVPLNPVVTIVSAKFVPRIDSIERSVSVPMVLSPVTAPVARSTLIPAAVAASLA